MSVTSLTVASDPPEVKGPCQGGRYQSPCGGDGGALDLECPGHPLEGRLGLMSCVRLMRAQAFPGLPQPLPRCQDLPAEYFGELGAGAQVVSVSHAWRNQAHPDPTGSKARALAGLLEGLPDTGAPRYLFLDFVSVPQRPFAQGQAPRRAEEFARFQAAVRCMHEMYFYSDHIVHLPWEDCAVAGEGEERWLPAACLAGCQFWAAAGGKLVQITAEGGEVGGGVRAFDVVVAVDDEKVESLERLEELLRSGAKQALLRSYPYGLPNLLPADRRGWVFLERFITMVKCAMMEEEMARGVVVTSCAAVEREIAAGAARLRRAAKSCKEGEASPELRGELEAFLRELECKEFSACSIDKQEDCVERQKTGDVSDRAAVTGIMREFVEHLGRNWSREARLQASLATRAAAAAAAAKEYLVRWPTFSEGYATRLEAASEERGGLALLRLALVPCLLAVLLVPLEEPTLQVSRMDHVPTLYFLVMPALLAEMWAIVPAYLFLMCGVPFSHRTLASVWGYIQVMQVPIVLLFLLLDWLGVRPVPLQFLWSWMVAAALLPGLWRSLPPQERRQGLWQQLYFFYTWYVVSALPAVLLLPFVNASLPSVAGGLRALLLLTFLAAKIALELLGTCMSKRVGSDHNPILIFHVVLAYEIQVCISFVKISDFFVVVMQVCFNLLENGYHVLSLMRLKLSKEEEQYLVAQLVLREFVELLTPLQFLGVYLTLVRLRPENLSISCGQTSEDVRRTLLFTLLSFSIGLLVTLVTFQWLRRRGHKPLVLLMAILRTTPFFCAQSLCLWTMNAVMQHSHWFNDYSLSFPWRDPEARWLCGYLWQP